MEEYLQRFLSLGKQETRPLVLLNLADVVERTLTLVRPKAQHLGVELKWSAPADPPWWPVTRIKSPRPSSICC